MDDASWKNQGSQNNFNHSGLNVENSNKEKMKGISYPRSSELSPRHNMAWDTNVPENGYLELGKCIESASSNINLDKKKHKVIVEDNNFHDGHNIKAHSNLSSEGLACNRHGPSDTSSLPYEEVNNLSFMRGKRKQHLSNFCESLGVASQNSETLCNQLSKRIPSDGWSGISSQNKSCGSVMELGEFRSPELRLNNYPELNFQFDDDSARVCQIESDELLARRLQEQYNEEVAGVMSTNEVNANVSGSSQETDSHLAASTTRSDQTYNVISTPITESHLTSTTRSDQTNNREEPMSDLYAYYTQLASQNPSSRSSNHSRHQMSNARRSFHSSEIDLETRLVAELRNFTRMDSKKRRDLLEALEAAFDQSNGALDDLNRDNDEMLSRGASQEQIDSLPQSTIQGAKVEEMCSICLEAPSFGDKIRHLPCLHKFHLQCIDVWLGRKACCPVCKLKVS